MQCHQTLRASCLTGKKKVYVSLLIKVSGCTPASSGTRKDKKIRKLKNRSRSPFGFEDLCVFGSSHTGGGRRVCNFRNIRPNLESPAYCLRPTACGTAAFVKISGRQKRFGISCCIYLKNRDLLKWNTCSTPAEPARECLFDRPLPGRWC